MTRLRRFIVHLRQTPRLYFQSPVNWHNVRALWRQAKPGWQLSAASPVVDLSDEEFEAFTDATNGDEDSSQRFWRPMAPITQAAVMALLDWEQYSLLEMGYDITYAHEDMPKVVAEAIKGWPKE